MHDMNDDFDGDSSESLFESESGALERMLTHAGIGSHYDIPTVVSRIGQLDIRRNSAGISGIFTNGLTALLEGNSRDAASYFEEAYAASRFEPAKVLAAFAYHALDDETAELRCYDEILLRNPHHECASSSKAVILFDHGERRKAFKLLNDALKYHPDSDTLLFTRAKAYFAIGELEKARRDADRCVEIDPRIYLPWELQGEIAAADGRFEDAVTAYTTCIDLRPDIVEHWTAKATMLATLERYDEAKELLHKGLDMHAHDPVFYCQLGLMSYDLGDLENAERFHTKALTIDPCYSHSLFYLGLVYWEQNRYEDACGPFTKALEHDEHGMLRIYLHEIVSAGSELVDMKLNFEARALMDAVIRYDKASDEVKKAADDVKKRAT